MSNPNYVIRRGRWFAEYPEGYVYFATFVEPRDVVKIGWSQNPWSRMRDLSFQYGAEIKILKMLRVRRGSRHWGVCYGSLESRIHRELARRRVHPWTLEFAERGEWYSMPPSEVEALVANIRRNVTREDQLEAAKLSGATSGPTSSSESNMESVQP